ncbi:MAG: hypothetical protein NVS3B23_00430 [Candidatus Saccharimonadales bacterium]
MASFGIVGVTGGLVYSQNNCLKSESSHFNNLSLYVNTGLNTNSTSTYYASAQNGCAGDVLCAAYNYGYNAGINAVQYTKNQGVSSATWWLDVETGNTWNSAVI